MSNDGPVQVAEPGLGLQFTPFGILPLGTSIAPGPEQHSPAAVPLRPVTAAQPGQVVAGQPSMPSSSAPAARVAPPSVSSRSVVKAARVRVKEIKIELRRAAALKRELDELERLLKAAKQKPEARIRALRAG